MVPPRLSNDSTGKTKLPLSSEDFPGASYGSTTTFPGFYLENKTSSEFLGLPMSFLGFHHDFPRILLGKQNFL